VPACRCAAAEIEAGQPCCSGPDRDGFFCTSRLSVGLTNALVYGVAAYAIALDAKKRRQLRGNPA